MAIIRFTRQRQAVLEAVQQSREHPDAARVFETVRHVMPSISLGTVYRSLEALALEGHLIKLSQPGKPTRYDARMDHHYHLVCDACGDVFDVTLVQMPDLRLLVLGMVPGFTVREQHIEFHGVCVKCQKN
jgi:Fur family transcriptional regulator, ferric uptake regulator